MATKRFTRYTKGRNQQVIVSKATAVSTQATLELFIANATAGQIGVYDGVGVLHDNAITSTELFTIVQKRSDGSIRKTTPQLWSNVTATRKAYVAPVKAVGSIGWDATNLTGALNLPSIAAGQFFELAVIETTEGNQPFPTWNFEYKSITGDVELDILQGLAKIINNSASIQYRNNKRLVSVKVKASATYGNYTTTGTYTVTNGSTLVATTVSATDPAVGDFISFDAAATPTSAVGDIYKVVAISAGVSFTLNRPYQGATQTFVAAEASGTRVKKVTAVLYSGLEFTSLENIAHFRLVARQNLNQATIENLTSFARGNGDSDMIGELEKEGNTFAGLTAGNTVFGNQAFGVEDLWVTDGETYDEFDILVNQFISQVAGGTSDRAHEAIRIAAPKSSGGISASLNTLFGT